jgi:cell division protein FtsX
MQKAIRSFVRIFIYGIKNFLRNAWLSTAAILVMTATLSVALITAAAYSVYKNQEKQIANKVTISINIKDDAKQDVVDLLISELKVIEGVKAVEYKSKEQVNKERIDMLKENAKSSDSEIAEEARKDLEAQELVGGVLRARIKVIPAELKRINQISEQVLSTKT